GLEYLEGVKVVHRDIKPSNILVGSEGEVKIGDFGVSKELVEGGTGAGTFTGTQGYLAPERLHNSDATTTSDIWSLGLTAMELALNRFPFPPPDHPPLTNPLDLMIYVEKEPSPKLPPGDWTKEFEEWCEGCLVKDGGVRWGVGECMASAFCQNAIASGLDMKSWVEEVRKVVPEL
ncbi:Protein kinase C signaling pathway involved MAPKK protein, partial [Rhizophlyctis rosea]